MTPHSPTEKRARWRSLTPGLPFVCGLAVLLRLPTFRYPLVSDDEAIYDAMAQVIVRGGTMYRDTVDHKPPGLAYTYGAVRALVSSIGGSFAAVMTGVHVVGVLAVVATCVALRAIARETLEPRLESVPPLLYACASAASVPPDSLAVNGELLMNLPTALAVACALASTRGERTATSRLSGLLVAGALAAVATLYKYQAALVLPALVLVAPNRASPASRGGQVAALGLGFLLPFGATALFFEHRGAWGDAVGWGLAFNAHYLSEGPDLRIAASRLGMQLLGVVLPSILVYGAGLFALARLMRRRAGAPLGVTGGQGLLTVWTLLALASVTLGRRFFGHYFLQPELPLSILAAGPVAHFWQRRAGLAVALLALPGVIFFVIAALPEVFARYVYAADPDYSALGRAVATRTQPTDTIWVWGNVPQVYFTAERAPGVRFTFCNYLTGLSPGSRSETDPNYDPRKNAVPGAWDMVLHDLDTSRPAIILDTAAGGMKSYGKFPVSSFPVLDGYLRAHYRADGAVQGAVIYRRAAE